MHRLSCSHEDVVNKQSTTQPIRRLALITHCIGISTFHQDIFGSTQSDSFSNINTNNLVKIKIYWKINTNRTAPAIVRNAVSTQFKTLRVIVSTQCDGSTSFRYLFYILEGGSFENVN